MNFFKTLAMVGLVILFGIGCYIAAGINVRRLVNKKNNNHNWNYLLNYRMDGMGIFSVIGSSALFVPRI
jgi:hypothetical protein